jgi:head-tail adaptor
MVEPFPLAEKLNLEINKDREFSQSAVRIYVQPATDVVYTDRIEHDGHTWNVLGHPGLWFDTKNNRHHKAVIAQIRQG